MALLRRALSVLNYAALAVMLGLIGLLLAGTLPAALGYESYVVTTSSMQPALSRGDLGVVAPVSVSSIAGGDVIVYRTPGDPDTVITRRVVSIAAATNATLDVVTTTDVSPSPESVTVSSRATLGRLAYAVPRLGTLLDLVNQPLGRVLLLGVPGLLLVTDALRGRLRRVQPAPDLKRVRALLDAGQRALHAGYPDLAARAADGALELHPGNAAAWHLKAGALAALKVDREHVAA